jgi:hypothetical protein
MTTATAVRTPIETGHALVEAISNRRFDLVEELGHPEIRLRSMNASGPVEVYKPEGVATFYHGDFASATSFETVDTSVRPMADRVQITWQFDVERPDGDGPETVEQHLFIKVVDGQILRIDQVCSGFRPKR